MPVLPTQIKMMSNLEQPTDYLEPEGEIVLISRHVNYAWGYDDSGVFVDSEGNVYPFDFHAQYGGLSKSSDLVQKLDFIRRCTNPAGQITPANGGHLPIFCDYSPTCPETRLISRIFSPKGKSPRRPALLICSL